MPHPRRINNMAGTSTPYQPGGPERRARITSHGGTPEVQEHHGPDQVRPTTLALHPPPGVTI